MTWRSFQPNTPLALQWHINDLLPEDPKNVKENWDKAKKNLQAAYNRRKKRFDHGRADHSFRTGDLVYWKTHHLSSKINKKMAKLSPRFEGPYQIMRFTSPVSVLLSDPSDGKIVVKRAHITQLKKFLPKASDPETNTKVNKQSWVNKWL